jgi:hypothetical protein
MRRRVGISYRVLAGAFILIIAGSIWLPAFGTNFGAYFANDRFHYYYYYQLSSVWTGPQDWVEDNVVAPTRMIVGSSGHDSSDASVYDNDYQCCTWQGYYSCDQAASSTICKHAHIQYNLRYTMSKEVKRAVACVENGHSVGLKHEGAVDGSCLKTVASNIWKPHDNNHVNNRY